MTTPETFLATQPESYIAYAPHGPGLECAVTYFVDDKHVYGWFIGFKDYVFPAAYFKLENFFSREDTIFYATDSSDVYGGWRYNYSKSQPDLDKPVPIEDEICHKLGQLEDAFANEWLWFRGDAGSEQEAAAYEKDEIAVQDVNVKHRKLGKLKKAGPIWTFESHGLNLDIVDYLALRWPLDYGKEER
jgi:hypothetical protein